MLKPLKPGPKLQALIDSGIARLEGTDYVATAADDVIVSLACIYDKAATVEAYLGEHPTPDTW